ncbi:MAG: hypothetical protein QM762_29770 [Chryseolinea sp.]
MMRIRLTTNGSPVESAGNRPRDGLLIVSAGLRDALLERTMASVAKAHLKLNRHKTQTKATRISHL